MIFADDKYEFVVCDRFDPEKDVLDISFNESDVGDAIADGRRNLR